MPSDAGYKPDEVADTSSPTPLSGMSQYCPKSGQVHPPASDESPFCAGCGKGLPKDEEEPTPVAIRTRQTIDLTDSPETSQGRRGSSGLHVPGKAAAESSRQQSMARTKPTQRGLLSAEAASFVVHFWKVTWIKSRYSSALEPPAPKSSRIRKSSCLI